MRPLLPADLAALQARADARTEPPYWPFAPLTSMQQAQRAAMQRHLQTQAQQVRT